MQAVSGEWTQLELDPSRPTVVTKGSECGGWRPGSSPNSGVRSLADTAQDRSCHTDEESETESSCSEVQWPQPRATQGGMEVWAPRVPPALAFCLCWPSSWSGQEGFASLLLLPKADLGHMDSNCRIVRLVSIERRLCESQASRERACSLGSEFLVFGGIQVRQKEASPSSNFQLHTQPVGCLTMDFPPKYGQDGAEAGRSQRSSKTPPSTHWQPPFQPHVSSTPPDGRGWPVGHPREAPEHVRLTFSCKL